MKLENAQKSLCVICSKLMPTQDYVLCMKCGKPCKPNLIHKIEQYNMLGIYDAKSDCCNYDVFFAGKITCTDQCHTQLLSEMENQFGMYKKVVDGITNIAYKVPTAHIIERGLRQEDLKNYPKWDQ